MFPSPNPKLINLIYRYKYDKKLLSKFPEQSEMLQRKINEDINTILEYITDESFTKSIQNLNI